MHGIKNASETRQFRNFKCQFAVGGKILQKEQSTVKDEARDQFRRTTRNVTVFGTSTAPKGTVSIIHQLCRDPVRRVIIHQKDKNSLIKAPSRTPLEIALASEITDRIHQLGETSSPCSQNEHSTHTNN